MKFHSASEVCSTSEKGSSIFWFYLIARIDGGSESCTVSGFWDSVALLVVPHLSNLDLRANITYWSQSKADFGYPTVPPFFRGEVSFALTHGNFSMVNNSGPFLVSPNARTLVNVDTVCFTIHKTRTGPKEFHIWGAPSMRLLLT